ncbi:M56 family metallopeptidase [Flavihumibacter profundi]|jgi:beta-lactamase regulating signal transducer with metallopeptidase domain|uniref:M56 family metallopeptidase n=1 Tax=Flavihumibacter profundi TaxID=2716883 RepID=UPI001CC6CD94|nr:M56 family metallopeptidase [Flavihumibacter profundi]MBZ5855809.1 M48 family metalloprotease [Flavihumibacter profundi]
MPNHPQAAFLEALGWTILNSTWQFGLLWFFFLFLKKVLPKRSAAVRYNLSLFFLLFGVSWAAFTLILRWNSLLGNGYQLASFSNIKLQAVYAQTRLWTSICLPYIAIIYLIWISFSLFRFSHLLLVSRQLKTSSLRKVPVDWRLFLDNMSAQLNISFSISIWISEKIDTPVILGWLKPAILLPVSALSNLSPDQLEAILIHELAHIKRNDYIWNIFIVLSEVFFYFNPFTHFLIAAIREEREHSCDDWVLQFSYQPQRYANALLQLEKHRINKHSQLILAARGSSRNLLLNRIQRMLNIPISHTGNHVKFALFTSLAVVFCAFGLLEPRQEIRRYLQESPIHPIISPEGNKPFYLPVQLGNKKRLAAVFSQKPLTNSKRIKDKIKPSFKSVDLLVPAEEANWIAIKSIYEAQKPVIALQTEERAFSLEEDQDEIPVPIQLNNFPYVPKSSFLANNLEDTLKRLEGSKVKLDNLHAMEVAFQAQLSLEKVNWDKLKAELENTGKSSESIQQEFEKALARIDWNKVQQEASKAVQQMEKLPITKKAVLTEQLQATYQLRQAQLEMLNKQLEKQQKDFRKAIEKHDLEMKKLQQKSAHQRKIVYI